MRDDLLNMADRFDARAKSLRENTSPPYYDACAFEECATKLRAIAAQCGEPVAWMLRHSQTGKWLWDAEACVFGDASAANDRADCENESDNAEPWEAVPLYAAPPSQPADEQDALRKVLQMFEAKLTELWGKTETPYAEAYGWLRTQAQDMESFNTYAAPPSQPVALPDGWKIEVNGEHLRVTKPGGRVSEWYERPKTNGSGMYDLCMALAAAPEVPRG